MYPKIAQHLYPLTVLAESNSRWPSVCDPALPPCQADADVAQQTIAERADTTGADAAAERLIDAVEEVARTGLAQQSGPARRCWHAP